MTTKKSSLNTVVRSGGFICSNTNIWARGLFPPPPPSHPQHNNNLVEDDNNNNNNNNNNNQHIFEFQSFPHNTSLLIDICLKDENTIKFACAKGSCIVLSTFHCQSSSSSQQHSKCIPLIIQQNVHSDKSNKKSSSSNSYKSSSLNNNENPISCLCWLTPDVIAVGYRNGVFRCYSGMTGELLLSKLFQKGKATLMSLKIFQCCISNETMDTREKGLWALYRDGSIVCIRMKDLLDGAYDVNNDVKYKRWKCQQRSKHIVPLDFVCSIPFRVDTFDLRPKVGININIAGEDPTVSQYFVTADKEKEIDSLGGLASVVMGAAFGAASSWFSSSSNDNNNNGGINNGNDSGNTMKDNSSSETWDESWDEVETIMIKTKLFVKDGHRMGERIILSPSGQIGCMTDNLGRIMLIDMDDMSIRRIWKGYRNAQCGWIVNDEGRKKEFLVIYAPQRSLIDIMSCTYGPRVARIHDPVLLTDGRLLYCNNLNSNSTITNKFSFSRCFFLKRDKTVIGNLTKTSAKSNPAKIDLFEIKLDQKANQIIKHALISSIHQDEGYLLHRFLNSLNSFVNTIKEQEQAKVTEMLQNVNENNNSVFDLKNNITSLDIESLKKVKAPILLVRAIGEIHEAMLSLPFITPNESFAAGSLLFPTKSLISILTVIYDGLHNSLQSEDNEMSPNDVKKYMKSLKVKIDLSNAYMILEKIPMEETFSNIETLYPRDINNNDNENNNSDDENGFTSSNVGKQFNDWSQFYNKYIAILKDENEDDMEDDDDDGIMLDDQDGKTDSNAYHVLRINPYSFLLCFQTNEDSTLSLSGYCNQNKHIKKSLLRYIFQTLLLHSFNLKLLFDFQDKLCKMGFESKQILDLFYEWFYSVPLQVLLHVSPENLKNNSSIVKWLHTFTLNYHVYVKNPFLIVPSITTSKDGKKKGSFIFHNMLINYILTIVWKQKLQLVEKEALYNDIELLYDDEDEEEEEREQGNSGNDGNSNSVKTSLNAYVKSYLESTTGEPPADDADVVLTHEMIDLLTENIRDTYWKQLQIQNIKLEIILFIRTCTSIVIGNYVAYNDKNKEKSGISPTSRYEKANWVNKILNRINLNTNVENIEFECVIAVLQLLKNEMNVSNNNSNSYLIEYEKYISNRSNVLKKYAGGDANNSTIDFIKWFQNEWITSKDNSPTTSLFQDNDTNECSLYSPFIGYNDACNTTFLFDLVSSDEMDGLELLVVLFSDFIDTNNLAIHRTLLMMNDSNHDKAGTSLQLYNYDLLYDNQSNKNDTSFTVPINHLETAIANLDAISDNNNILRLCCYLQVFDLSILHKVAFLHTLWKKKPLDGILYLIYDMADMDRDAKENRSVVTNDEINENVKGLLNKFTQAPAGSNNTDDPQAHSTLAKNGWCGEILHASKRQQNIYFDIVLGLLQQIKNTIQLYNKDKISNNKIISLTTTISSGDSSNNDTGCDNYLNMCVFQSTVVNTLLSKYENKDINGSLLDNFIIMIRILAINMNCNLWNIDVEKLYPDNMSNSLTDSYFHPSNHGGFLIPTQENQRDENEDKKSKAMDSKINFTLTGNSPLHMQYRMRTMVEIMIKDKKSGYNTVFQLAPILQVPNWFIQFEYIKRLIRTGKELYAEEELKKIDFKMDENVRMGKLLLGFCSKQLVDVIKAMKNERKYRSLVASVPGESYRLALSLGKKYDSNVERMEFVKPRKSILINRYFDDRRISTSNNFSNKSTGNNDEDEEEEEEEEDLIEDEEEVDPSLSATHAFFNILSNFFQNDSKEQRQAITLAETVSNLREAAQRL